MACTGDRRKSLLPHQNTFIAVCAMHFKQTQSSGKKNTRRLSDNPPFPRKNDEGRSKWPLRNNGIKNQCVKTNRDHNTNIRFYSKINKSLNFLTC